MSPWKQGYPEKEGLYLVAAHEKGNPSSHTVDTVYWSDGEWVDPRGDILDSYEITHWTERPLHPCSSSRMADVMAGHDTKLAIDYLQDLFEKLAAGRLDPARVDWPFAAEAWRVVCGEIERLRGECRRFEHDLGYLRRCLQANEEVAQAKSMRVLDLLEERDELHLALARSLKLQSHYATLLNMHDGGQRMAFADVQAWLNRLRELSGSRDLARPGEG